LARSFALNGEGPGFFIYPRHGRGLWASHQTKAAKLKAAMTKMIQVMR